MVKDFYSKKKIFIPGHTGFKGSWLCRLLLELGADVYGYSLQPTPEQQLYDLSGIKNNITSYYGDIRDFDYLMDCVKQSEPDIIFHLAAQPLVLESYGNPIYTYSTNVMGTVNILEAARKCSNLLSVINVTTDKVYYNRETKDGYVEDDILNGYDPYSNSKSCSELVTSSYRNSFFSKTDIAVSTCRAGNVIGGGDFSKNRIIPDCYRAVSSGQNIVLRNPNSVRPYQHVLDPLYAYLLTAQKQCLSKEKYEGSYNIGPDKDSNITTGKLADLFCTAWGNGAGWISEQNNITAHEANLLYLNCDKAKKHLGWSAVWDIKETVEKTVDWYLCYHNGDNVELCIQKQINEFIKEALV